MLNYEIYKEMKWKHQSCVISYTSVKTEFEIYLNMGFKTWFCIDQINKQNSTPIVRINTFIDSNTKRGWRHNNNWLLALFARHDLCTYRLTAAIFYKLWQESVNAGGSLTIGERNTSYNAGFTSSSRFVSAKWNCVTEETAALRRETFFTRFSIRYYVRGYGKRNRMRPKHV